MPISHTKLQRYDFIISLNNKMMPYIKSQSRKVNVSILLTEAVWGKRYNYVLYFLRSHIGKCEQGALHWPNYTSVFISEGLNGSTGKPPKNVVYSFDSNESDPKHRSAGNHTSLWRLYCIFNLLSRQENIYFMPLLKCILLRTLIGLGMGGCQ